MEPIVVHTGTTILIMNDDIDTDQIIPKQFLKNLLKTGYENALFYNWRYLPDGSPDPKFILNAPDRQEATILIMGVVPHMNTRPGHLKIGGSGW